MNGGVDPESEKIVVLSRLFAVIAAVFLVSSASATTVNFTGAFTHDDDSQVFFYRVDTQGSVTVNTTSFGSGGFVPVLSLFTPSGDFLFLDSGNTNSTDALLSWVSDADTN